MTAFYRDDLEFGMHRMFHSLFKGKGQALNTVRDLDEAAKPLEIDRRLLDRVIAEIDRIDASESA